MSCRLFGSYWSYNDSSLFGVVVLVRSLRCSKILLIRSRLEFTSSWKFVNCFVACSCVASRCSMLSSLSQMRSMEADSFSMVLEISLGGVIVLVTLDPLATEAHVLVVGELLV